MYKLLFLIILFSSTLHAEVYRCKDKQGNIHYQREACTDNKSGQALNIVEMTADQQAKAKASLDEINAKQAELKLENEKKAEILKEQQKQRQELLLKQQQIAATQRQAEALEEQTRALEQQRQFGYPQSPFQVSVPLSIVDSHAPYPERHHSHSEPEHYRQGLNPIQNHQEQHHSESPHSQPSQSNAPRSFGWPKSK